MTVEAYLPHVATRVSINAILWVLVVIEACLWIWVLRRARDRQLAIGAALVALGLPLLLCGLAFHVDAKLTRLLTPTVPFPGWEAVAFTFGLTFLLHGLFWQSMLSWRRLSRAIDYVWYLGALFAITLGAATYYKSQEVALFQSTFVSYQLAKEKAILGLTSVGEHCDKPDLIQSREAYAASPHASPSPRLCELANDELGRWERDVLISLDGSFDFRLLDPNYRHATGSAQQDASFYWAFTMYLDSSAAKESTLMCATAAEELARSGWEGIERKEVEERALAKPLPSAAFPDIDLPRVGGRVGKMVIDRSESPPHLFGADACAVRAAVFEDLEAHAGRSFLIISPVMSHLASSWSMLLGLLIAVRLLKTTVEFRNEQTRPQITTTGEDQVVVGAVQTAPHTSAMQATPEDESRDTEQVELPQEPLSEAPAQPEGGLAEDQQPAVLPQPPSPPS